MFEFLGAFLLLYVVNLVLRAVVAWIRFTVVSLYDFVMEIGGAVVAFLLGIDRRW